MKNKFLLLTAFICIPRSAFSLGAGQRAQRGLLDTYNQTLLDKAQPGEFYFDQQGHLLFNGDQSPQWAISEWKRINDIDPNDSLGGLDPFKMYTRAEHEKHPIHACLIKRNLYLENSWLEREKQNGALLIRDAKEKAGPGIFKEMVQEQQREAWLNYWLGQLPTIVKALLTPTNGLLVFSAVSLALGVPLIFWHFSKAFFGWLFTPRPIILTDKDTNIYGNVLYRLRWRFPNVPKVITDPELQAILQEVIEKNKKITCLNKGGFLQDPVKTPYFTLCLYGPSGTGKTLFAKNLAKESGMNFIYLTLSSLSQLAEEEALQTLSAYFRYAEKFTPCILIIDEADRLFNKHDIKAQKLTLMFQQHFSKAVHESIQLIFITNYPHQFPPAILNRVSKFIQFDLPSFETQQQLFKEHLHRAFALNKNDNKEIANIAHYLGKLDETLCEGLVGRDIENICLDLALDPQVSPSDLPAKIKAYKKQRRLLAEFVLPDQGYNSAQEEAKQEKGASHEGTFKKHSSTGLQRYSYICRDTIRVFSHWHYVPVR